MISFVLSNPRHHAEIMLPAARTLRDRGLRCQVISLAELRGLETPTWDTDGIPAHRLVPLRRRKRGGATTAAAGQAPRLDLRGIAQMFLWNAALGPRLRWLLRGSSAVVIPNDSVFPYLQLVRSLRARRIPFVLVQEGIRYKLPCDDATAYGTNGAAKICAWGDGSAQYFRSIGASHATIEVTGNPRFDRIEPNRFREIGREVLHALGIATAPLLFLSNPIELQGYGTVRLKLDLFAKFLQGAQGVLEQSGVPLVVRLHPHEDPGGFQAVARRMSIPISISDRGPLFALLAVGRAAVVLSSTVGLEALAFGLPLGVLEIPRHGFAFEYVAQGAATALRHDSIESGLRDLLATNPRQQDAATTFVERHLAHRGNAHERIADAIALAARPA